ncbi:MAG: hypothetical protein LQ338_007526 [Usnochroma carphineum]|nr:MAG: hypothetical protein LQ338_007526 [Usnochroma carphineum]
MADELFDYEYAEGAYQDPSHQHMSNIQRFLQENESVFPNRLFHNIQQPRINGERLSPTAVGYYRAPNAWRPNMSIAPGVYPEAACVVASSLRTDMAASTTTAPLLCHTAERFNVTGHGRVQVGDIHNYGSTTEERDCLRSLWPTGIDYESQKNQNPERVLGTCLWTLDNPKYIGWRDDDAKKLLWISADPGCGKSVLARYIIDEDLPQAFQNNPSKRVLYYFFKDTSLEQRSAARAISAILHQLFVSQYQLIRHALPSYRAIGPALSTTFPKLWSIFAEAATDPLAGDLICVLDALDECDERQTLIEALENFCVHRQTLFSASRLKFLVTSRPYFDIRRSFDELRRGVTFIELAGNDESASIKEEINIVIKHRVAKLAQENCLAKKVTDHLEKRLLETEHRTYLWLRLLWEIIRKSLLGTITEMNKLIDDLPAGIQECYEILLQKCPEPAFAKRVFQIVLVACRPLTLGEVDVALKVSKQTSSHTDLELDGPSRLQETLPTRCGLMVSIVQSKVYFIHQTVKEFLLDKHGMGPPAGRPWQQSLRLKESHNVMAKSCLRSITLSDVRLDRVNLCNALLPEDLRDMEPNENCRGYGLLSYAATYWAEHCRKTRNSEDMGTITRFLESSSSRSIFGGNMANYGTVLHAASAGGHEEIVQIILEKGADVNAQGGYFGTALQAASYMGHSAVVQILLEKGADVNAQGGYFGTALRAASYMGHNTVMQVLLENAVELKDMQGRASIHLACAGGSMKIVKLLSSFGPDWTTTDLQGRNCLHHAASTGSTEIVRWLLKEGFDPNAADRDGWTPLHWAGRRGSIDTITALKAAGANSTAEAIGGWTPGQVAAFHHPYLSSV